MHRHTAHNLLLAGTLLWCAMIVLPTLAPFIGAAGSWLARLVYGCCTHICHQYDSRSLHLFGHPLAVCGRCTGIYAGFLAGVVLARTRITQPQRTVLPLWCVALFPMLADVGLDAIGLHASTMTSRLVTGGVFGAGAASILGPLVIDACVHSSFLQWKEKLYATET